MPRYEYKVVPAPTKGLKGKGVRGAEARFSNSLQQLINDTAAKGWEYQRAETLPSVERSGLASSTTEWRHVLIFRRPAAAEAEAFAPELLPPPEPAMPAPEGNTFFEGDQDSPAAAETTEGTKQGSDPASQPKSPNGYDEEYPVEIDSFSPTLKQLFEDIKSKKSAD